MQNFCVFQYLFFAFIFLGSISENTKVVLVNVLYFKDQWAEAFTDVVKKPFNVGGKNTIQTDTLVGDKTVAYEKSSDGTETVRIPFEDDIHDFVVVLPAKNSGNMK